MRTVTCSVESELATFNLYCCRPRLPLDWGGLLSSELGAREVTVQTVLRGARAGKGA